MDGEEGGAMDAMDLDDIQPVGEAFLMQARQNSIKAMHVEVLREGVQGDGSGGNGSASGSGNGMEEVEVEAREMNEGEGMSMEKGKDMDEDEDAWDQISEDHGAPTFLRVESLSSSQSQAQLQAQSQKKLSPLSSPVPIIRTSSSRLEKVASSGEKKDRQPSLTKRVSFNMKNMVLDLDDANGMKSVETSQNMEGANGEEEDLEDRVQLSLSTRSIKNQGISTMMGLDPEHDDATKMATASPVAPPPSIPTDHHHHQNEEKEGEEDQALETVTLDTTPCTNNTKTNADTNPATKRQLPPPAPIQIPQSPSGYTPDYKPITPHPQMVVEEYENRRMSPQAVMAQSASDQDQDRIHEANEMNEDPAILAESVSQVDEYSLSEFSKVTSFFTSKILIAAAGRKYKDLRQTCRELEQAVGDPHAELSTIRSKWMSAVECMLDSGKVAVVELGIDYLNILMDKGYLGNGTMSRSLSRSSADSKAMTVAFRLDAEPSTFYKVLKLVRDAIELGDDAVYLRVNQLIVTAASRTLRGIHDVELLDSTRTMYNTYLNIESAEGKKAAEGSLHELARFVFASMEKSNEGEHFDEDGDGHHLPESVPATVENTTTPVVKRASSITGGKEQVISMISKEVDKTPETNKKDAYLIFRAFCKLASKDIPEGTGSEAVALSSRLLALQLLRSIVADSGHAFRSSKQFIFGMKTHLAPTLVTCCLGTSTVALDISLQIFDILIRRDSSRAWLKFELETLFTTVILRFLESPTAGYLRRRRAILFLASIFEEPQVMVDFFVNYDCDLSSPHIFSRSVLVLTSGLNFYSGKEIEDQDIRSQSLAALRNILTSLKKWYYSSTDEQGPESESPDGASPMNGEDIDAAAKSSELGHSHSVASVDGLPAMSRAALAASASSFSAVSGSQSMKTFKQKKILETGVDLFNRSAKRGLKFLVENGVIKELKPDLVAQFLLNTQSLDATVIGEYLGDMDPFNISVMHAYADSMDMSGLNFDDAIRFYLKKFRLPGEAQKIDRIMEKFAQRFCECNPGTFANADTGYILGYSVIMLNTDIHNDQVKKKMTKEEFLRNNRGINDGADLSAAFLGGIYDRIKQQPLKLQAGTKDSKSAQGAAAVSNTTYGVGALDAGQRSLLFRLESEQVLEQTKQKFANRKLDMGQPGASAEYIYLTGSEAAHGRLMFSAVWHAILASLSIALERPKGEQQEQQVVRVLECFREFAVVASLLSLNSERDVIVASLSRFAEVSSFDAPYKNILSLKTLFTLASRDGIGLGSFWPKALKSASWISEVRADLNGELQQLSVSRLRIPSLRPSELSGKKDERRKDPKSFQRASSTASSTASNGSLVTSLSGSSEDIRVKDWILDHDFKNKERYEFSFGGKELGSLDPKQKEVAVIMIAKFADIDLDQVFFSSDRYPLSELLTLLDALNARIKVELESNRTYSLQKLVTVCAVNMNSRTRIHWMRIWECVSPIFANLMSHSILIVSMYSINVMGQLFSRFVEKEELTNYSFQRKFLEPFVDAFVKCPSAYPKEVILEVISDFCMKSSDLLQSGWKPVFHILSTASAQNNAFLVELGFTILDQLLRKSDVSSKDFFLGAVACLTAFSRCSSERICCLAFEHLMVRCPYLLAEGKIEEAEPIWVDGQGLPTEEASSDGSAACRSTSKVSENLRPSMVADSSGPGDDTKSRRFSDSKDGHIQTWIPILLALSNGVSDLRESVRQIACDGIVLVLREYGGLFSSGFWMLIFRGVIKPMFDDVFHLPGGARHSDEDNEKLDSAWSATIGASALKQLIDVWALHHRNSFALLPDILSLVRSLILQESESVAREGINAFGRLVIDEPREVLTVKEWDAVIIELKTLFQKTNPSELVSPAVAPNGDDLKERVNHLEAEHLKAQAEMDENDGFVKKVRKQAPAKSASPAAAATRPGHAAARTGQPHANVSATSSPGAESGAKSRPELDFRVIRTKCVSQLLLIGLVEEMVTVNYLTLSTLQILSLVDSLETCFAFAHEFNSNVELRMHLWRAGFMSQVPNLLRQEMTSLHVILRLLFWFYLDRKRDTMGPSMVQEKLFDLCRGIVSSFSEAIQQQAQDEEEHAEVAALAPIIVFIMECFLQLNNEDLTLHLNTFYPLLLGLLESDYYEVRVAVLELFRTRISPHFVQATSLIPLGALDPILPHGIHNVSIIRSGIDSSLASHSGWDPGFPSIIQREVKGIHKLEVVSDHDIQLYGNFIIKDLQNAVARYCSGRGIGSSNYKMVLHGESLDS